MSILRVATIEPEGATTTLTLGASGDTVTSSADSIKANTFKDAGGNTLWTSNGSGTLSSVNSAFDGYGPVFVRGVYLSGNSTCDINSYFTSTYDAYMFTFTNMQPANDNTNFGFQVSTNSGSSYGIALTSAVWDSWHNENGNTGLRDATGYQRAGSTSSQTLSQDQGNGADECGAGVLYIYNPANTTYYKNFHFMYSSYHTSDYYYYSNGNGYIQTTSAINGIRFDFSSGSMSGYIRMYGIR